VTNVTVSGDRDHVPLEADEYFISIQSLARHAFTARQVLT
jgi:hypothetical protein